MRTVWRLRYEACLRADPAMAAAAVAAAGGTLAGAAAADAVVPDPDFADPSASAETMDTRTHRRLVYAAWLVRDKKFVSDVHGVSIMHGDTPQYWDRRRGSRDSLCGHVAFLKTVCWFDMKVSKVVRHPGSYLVSLRVRVGTRVSQASKQLAVQLGCVCNSRTAGGGRRQR